MTTQAAESRRDRWAPRFFAIWTGQAFSLLGSMLVQFALVWWLTQTTGSATVLATATLVAVLPGIFIGPVSGTLVDRWNRRLVMIVADGLIALVTLGLIGLYVAGAMQVWHVYAVMFIRATLGGFHWPAMQASTSLMVPKEQLSRIAGLNQTLYGVMNIISPPLGAFLLGLLPLHGIMAIDIVTALLAITPLFFVPIPQPERTAGLSAAAAGERRGTVTTVLADFKVGLRYVSGWPGLLAILIMAMLLNFIINPAFSLMPFLVTKHFGRGAIELGWLESAWGVGVVTGGLTLSAWGGFRRRVVTSLIGIIGMGAGTLAIGLSPATAFGLALAGMFFGGFMNPIANGPFMAIMQAAVAPEMQGRVFSLIQSAASAMMPLSLLVAGPVADAVGVRAWYLVGGAACVVIGLFAFTVPAIMNVEHNGHGARSAVMDEPTPAAATGSAE
jgi:DHA3 family macrolide efflux protein-like MFS transporter